MITSTSQPEKYLARFTDGTHEALADTAPEYGGAFAGFKPVDLLEAALANCITMVVRIAADKRNIPLTGISVRVGLNRENKDESVFEYAIDMQGDLTDEQRATLLRAASGCPVKKILSGAVSFKDVG
ncbi:MAG TPA: OsmC family protein [Humidesulfovibrio sp.]|uniref:OsmC family protein n=1 Tax=Humidesulfovibrio sp. TaxID=2910988 RepID=UPI002C5FAB8B|nr:OsmC family protein [Humidesulfovibrio sp.]HWR04943.1 OsmC family protein [Humidesulfovibrio sp.]